MNWSFSRWRNGRQSPVSDPEPRPYAFEVIPPVLRTDFLRMVTLPPGIDKETCGYERTVIFVRF